MFGYKLPRDSTPAPRPAPAPAATPAPPPPPPPPPASSAPPVHRQDHDELVADIDHMFPPKLVPKRRLVLLITPGEKDPIEALTARYIKLRRERDVVPKPQDVGDIGFAYADDPTRVLRFHIELKRASDLASSIVDGRFREQFNRMMHSGLTGNNVMYLLYGNLRRSQYGAPFKSRMGAAVKKPLRDGVSVGAGTELDYIADFVVFIHHYLEYLDESEFARNSYDYMDGGAGDTNKSVVLAEHFYERVLGLVKGVSPVVARAIKVRHASFASLVNAYMAAGPHGAPTLLKDITYTTDTGNTRCIGPAVSKRIAEVFQAADFGISQPAGAPAPAPAASARPSAPPRKRIRLQPPRPVAVSDDDGDDDADHHSHARSRPRAPPSARKRVRLQPPRVKQPLVVGGDDVSERSQEVDDPSTSDDDFIVDDDDDDVDSDVVDSCADSVLSKRRR